MGKGGALSTWLRELMVLIFTQTMQAFIFAIIISIVMYAMVSTEGLPAADTNASLGLMSTFAMFSIFKIEAYAKKIFGMQDSPASPGSAMKSLAKTAFAVSIGKRVLNNVGKFTGGVRKISKAGQDRRKVKKRLDEDMKDEGYEVDKNGKYAKSQKTSSVATLSRC